MRTAASKTTVRVPPRPVHPFPARMAAAIPWEELSTHGSRLRVLDPMSGSGTTLAVARTLGHRAIGFDTDPLAVLIGQAWCQDVQVDRTRATARTVLRRAKRRRERCGARATYPHGADEETRRFVRYWFDLTNRRQL